MVVGSLVYRVACTGRPDGTLVVPNGTQELLNKTGAVRVRPFERRLRIRHGDYGTADTIKQMVRLAGKGGSDLLVRLHALDIVDGFGIPGRDHERLARRLFSWVQDLGDGEKSGVKFVNDPVAVELVQEPWFTLAVGSGDCDDFATLMAALLLSLGIPAFIRTVKVNPKQPDLFSHVYAVAVIRGKCFALDTSIGFSRFGSEPTMSFGKQDWKIPRADQSDYA